MAAECGEFKALAALIDVFGMHVCILGVAGFDIRK
jgi:hypothetical protein